MLRPVNFIKLPLRKLFLPSVCCRPRSNGGRKRYGSRFRIVCSFVRSRRVCRPHIREPSLCAAWLSKSGDEVFLSLGTTFLVVSSWTNHSNDHDAEDAGIKYWRRCRTLFATLRSTDLSGHDDGVARAVCWTMTTTKKDGALHRFSPAELPALTPTPTRRRCRRCCCCLP